MNQDRADQAVELIQRHRDAALATLETDGPYASACGYLYEPLERLGIIYILLSDLARHSKNIAKNSSVSLLIVENAPLIPIHEKKRATLRGHAQRTTDPEKIASLKKRYLEAFPRSEIFFTLPDFRFYEIAVLEIHWIGGFGKAATLS